MACDLLRDELLLAPAVDEAAGGDGAEGEDGHVLAHAQRKEQPLGVAVPGQVHDAGTLDASRVARRDLPAAQRDLAARRQQAGEAAQELALPVALDAGEADDLAGSDIEVDAVEARAAQPAHV